MALVNEKSDIKRRVRHVGNVPVIGWREWLTVPALNIDRIKAKIDTGARTSSIHAYDVELCTVRGATHVSFVVCPEQRRRQPAIRCVSELIDERMVTSSSGHRERRYVVKVDVGLGGIVVPIELTLANRDTMGFRMLLGREAIRNRFLINPGRSHLAGRCHADISTIVARKGK